MELVTRIFADRADAGRRLAELLSDMELDHPVIYALPRGGVPVAVEIAKSMNAPLDLLLKPRAFNLIHILPRKSSSSILVA